MSTTLFDVSTASHVPQATRADADEVFIVWVKMGARHTPVAACGRPELADVVKAGMALLVQQQPEMLQAVINTVPRAAVPTLYESIP